MTEFEPDQPWSPRQPPAVQGPASAPTPLVSPDGQLPGAGYPPQQPAQGYPPQQPAQGYPPQQPAQQQPTQGYAPQQPAQQQSTQGYAPQQPVQQQSTQGYAPQQPVQQQPTQGYAPQQPTQGYAPQQPVQQQSTQGYAPQQPTQVYPPQQPVRPQPTQGYAPQQPVQGYPAQQPVQQPAQGYASPQQPVQQQTVQQPPAQQSFAPTTPQAQPMHQPDLSAQQGTSPYAAPRPNGYVPPSQPAPGAPQTGTSNGYAPTAAAQPPVALPQGPLTGSQPAVVPQVASQPWGQQAAAPPASQAAVPAQYAPPSQSAPPFQSVAPAQTAAPAQTSAPAQALPPLPAAQPAIPGGGGFFAPVGAPSAPEHITPARTEGDRDEPERGEADKRGVSPIVASLFGLLAAIVAAIGYASLSFAVGKEYMALLILIGAAAGFTVSLSVREESLGTGIVSMVWSVLGVFAASSLLVAMKESGSIVGGFSAFPAVDFYAVFLGYFQQVLNYVWLLAALFVGYLTGAGARFR